MPSLTEDISAAVWRVVAAIPPGRVCTYGDVAARAGYPRHARAVGRILKHLPADSSLPWHRVVNAQGRISLPVESESHRRQRERLEAEGLRFDVGGNIGKNAGRISLSVYRWND